MSHSPYSQQIADPAKHGSVSWTRGLAERHIVYVVGQKATELAALPTSRAAAQAAIAHLDQANALFANIAAGIPTPLKQESQNLHQHNWRSILQELLDRRGDDYDCLEMMQN
jgi:hypothetical protein